MTTTVTMLAPSCPHIDANIADDADVTAIARDHEHFSSRQVSVLAEATNDGFIAEGDEPRIRLAIASCPEFAIDIEP